MACERRWVLVFLCWWHGDPRTDLEKRISSDPSASSAEELGECSVGMVTNTIRVAANSALSSVAEFDKWHY